jgi:hypothetical protein
MRCWQRRDLRQGVRVEPRQDGLAIIRNYAGSRIVKVSEALEYIRSGVAKRRGVAWKKINGKSQLLPRFDMKRISGASDMVAGESARMRPSKPSSGAIIRSGYAKRLDQFVAGDKNAIRLFRARRTPRHKGGVPHEVATATRDRAILFMPHVGKQTKPEHEILGLNP